MSTECSDIVNSVDTEAKTWTPATDTTLSGRGLVFGPHSTDSGRTRGGLGSYDVLARMQSVGDSGPPEAAEWSDYGEMRGLSGNRDECCREAVAVTVQLQGLPTAMTRAPRTSVALRVGGHRPERLPQHALVGHSGSAPPHRAHGNRTARERENAAGTAATSLPGEANGAGRARSCPVRFRTGAVPAKLPSPWPTGAPCQRNAHGRLPIHWPG